MSERPLTPDELTALLERLRLEPAGLQSASEVTQAQLDLLVARIGSLTDALRSAANDDTSRLASRLLIGDLALVAAQLRGRANEIAASLTHAVDGLPAAGEDLP